MRLAHKVYYALKPYVPWTARMALRRYWGRRVRAENRDIWPIDPSAGNTPGNWPGWPEGRQFAFALTHDVEGPDGLAKVRQLAEVEMKHGFRSSFNFIPDGPYSVSAELRDWLVSHGFEVGVHDLHHDGKLYRSREDFRNSARRINEHLKSWGAVGYRSGFMLHNLDWHHDLEVLYDASTFDTDPLEFQPDGARTIFPFWVEPPEAARTPSGHRPGGYVELPYTLPQDSTLFLVLQEKTPKIWLDKLDWVASRGGMALVNVHPDYLRFAGESKTAKTFDVGHYEQLLQRVRTVYGDRAWSVLPKTIARHTRDLKTKRPRQPRHVAMVTHSFYESDNRVTRYAETLAARGDHVDIYALRLNPESPAHEIMDGVHVHRILPRVGGDSRSKFAYFWSWFRFLAKSATRISSRHRQQPYDLIHVHNMPDFLVLAAWNPRRQGAKVILDIHDVVPELYASKFGEHTRNLTQRVLEWTERFSAAIADHIIISNHLWHGKYTARTRSSDRCSVFINNVDATMFRDDLRTRHENDGKRILIFPGSLQWHQGLDIAIRAFHAAKDKLNGVEFHIYGDGNMRPKLIELTAELQLETRVKFFNPVGLKEVARIMANADVGVVPKRADSFGNEAYSTKIMEFMAVGVPVVISRTKIDQYYFNDRVVRFFESGNVDALAQTLVEVFSSESLRRQLVERAGRYAAANSWANRQAAYLRIVDDLIDGRPITPEVALADLEPSTAETTAS